MIGKTLATSVVAVLVLSLAVLCQAGMESENYRITTSAMSGGGNAMGSANYQLNGTLGQSSPLMDPASPPYSDSYDLYPGFWYTVGLGYGCWFDLDSDGDVDGEDLADFAAAFQAVELGLFAEELGRVDCGLPQP